MQHSREVAGHGVPLDYYYMSELGPSAIPALDEFLATAKFASEGDRTSFSLLRAELADRVIYARTEPPVVQLYQQDWQEWTWREERLRAYLLEHPFSPGTLASID